ncbi:MAG: RNA-binding S4 domain-containing protein [Paludibacteraceae bacterium]|nr:RNA-binding S4 domain-containing protein [Paludibacteraceae bacterium]
MPKTEVRIDKWLWAVRLFKTRSLAVEACKKGKVTINGVAAKPSRNVKVGEVLLIRKPPIVYSFKVLALAENRMGAKLVPNFMKNVTAKDQLEMLELMKLTGDLNRAKGLGRPTKKDRRELDSYVEPTYVDDEWDFDFSDEEDLNS